MCETMALRERWVLGGSRGFIEVTGKVSGIKVDVIITNPRFNGEKTENMKEIVRDYAAKIDALIKEIANIARVSMGADSVGVRVTVVKNFEYVPIEKIPEVVTQSLSQGSPN